MICVSYRPLGVTLRLASTLGIARDHDQWLTALVSYKWLQSEAGSLRALGRGLPVVALSLESMLLARGVSGVRPTPGRTWTFFGRGMSQYRGQHPRLWDFGGLCASGACDSVGLGTDLGLLVRLKRRESVSFWRLVEGEKRQAWGSGAHEAVGEARWRRVGGGWGCLRWA